MGKRGPKAQPTVLKILRGNPGKRALNHDEPQPQSGFPPCPEHLSSSAREAWGRFGEQLAACGVGTRLDGVALELLCSAYAAYLDAADKVAKGGAVWVDTSGGGGIPKFAYSPYWAVKNRERETLVKLLAEFGMTPSSRSGIHVDKPAQSTIAKRTRA